MKQFKSLQFQTCYFGQILQSYSFCIIGDHLSIIYFPLWLNWGISISLSADIGGVATSFLNGTFAQTAFCDHFCSTGEAGISGGGRRGRAHLSLTWTWQRRCLKTRWTTKCVVAYLKKTKSKTWTDMYMRRRGREGGRGRVGDTYIFMFHLLSTFWLDEGGSCGSSDVLLALDVSRASRLNTKLRGELHYGFLCFYFENSLHILLVFFFGI